MRNVGCIRLFQTSLGLSSCHNFILAPMKEGQVTKTLDDASCFRCTRFLGWDGCFFLSNVSS